MITIGASKEAVQEAKQAILNIMSMGNEEATIRCALKVLRDVCQIKKTTISGCTFRSGADT